MTVLNLRTLTEAERLVLVKRCLIGWIVLDNILIARDAKPMIGEIKKAMAAMDHYYPDPSGLPTEYKWLAALVEYHDAAEDCLPDDCIDIDAEIERIINRRYAARRKLEGE
jgi:hypothetical protein